MANFCGANKASCAHFKELDICLGNFSSLDFGTNSLLGTAFVKKMVLILKFEHIMSNISGLKANISHRRTWGIPKSYDCFGLVFSDWSLIF